MSVFRSMRWRLQLWYGMLLLVVLTGFDLTAYRLESARQIRRIDEELGQLLPVLVASQHPSRLDRERRELTVSPLNAALFDRGGTANAYYVVWLKHGAPVTYSATAPRDVPEPAVGDPPTRMRGTLRETFIFPGPGDCVLVGRSIATDLAGLRQLAWVLGGGSAAVLLLGIAGGAWLVSRALRPIRAINAAATRISTGDLTQRISTPDTQSEIGQLTVVLNSTFARLDAAFAQQARFTADAAHELRTPVTVILTQAQSALGGDCGLEEHREALAATQRAAQRMRRLIESLLELSRLDAGQEALRQSNCDLSRIVSECLELIMPLAAERSIRIKADLTEAPCSGDADRLAQVVTNLLGNAVDYNRDGGSLTVATGHNRGVTTLTATNTGPGISAADLPHVFERFYRADRARSGGAGHNGLGLAISKSIILAHGGTIEVQSTPEDGTCFTVTLPAGPQGD